MWRRPRARVAAATAACPGGCGGGGGLDGGELGGGGGGEGESGEARGRRRRRWSDNGREPGGARETCVTPIFPWRMARNALGLLDTSYDANRSPCGPVPLTR